MLPPGCDHLRLGILGTGKIVNEVLILWDRLDVRKTILLSTERSLEKAQAMAARYGLDGAVTDYEALLRSDVDAVYVALPNHLHYRFAEAALRHGKHVILEKPATASVGELLSLMELAGARGCILLEAVSVHYLPAFRALKRQLKQIGQVRQAVLNYSQLSSRYGDLLQGKVHPVFDAGKAGGALYDINVYNIHAAVSLFGEPQSVRYTANLYRGIDVSGVMILDYGRFKVTCVGEKDRQRDNRSVIRGEQGLLRVDAPLNRMTDFTLRSASGEVGSFSFPVSHRLLPELRELFAIIDGRDYDRAEEMMKISLAAAEILEAGRLQAGLAFPPSQPASGEKSRG